MTLRSVIAGCGSYLPEKVVTNDDLAKIVDTSDQWIVERTGIRARHVAAENQYTSDLATFAAKAALEDAQMDIGEIDAIIVATATPDKTYPSTAVFVQENLGMTRGFAFDVQAVCSGFIYASNIADCFIKSGQEKKILVIGAETFTRTLNYEDRASCVLFGDGAGAVIYQAQEQDGNNHDRGILSVHLHSDGRLKDLLITTGGVSTTQTAGHLVMQGRETFRHAVTKLSQVVYEALEATGLKEEDIDWLVPHQANKRILDGTARKLGLNPDQMIVTVHNQANTSAASVPLALDTAVKDGRIKRGDLLLMEAMGAGLTWGSMLVRY
jgi:3-oxoacyl-[acyl-carrier-protein] synthase III